MRPIRIASCIALKLLPPPDTKIASFAGLRKLRGIGSSAACSAQQIAWWPLLAVLCRCLPNTKAARWQAPMCPGQESFAASRREQDASLDDEQAPNSIFEATSGHHGHVQYRHHNRNMSGILNHKLASDPLRCAANCTIANRSCRLRNARLTPASGYSVGSL